MRLLAVALAAALALPTLADEEVAVGLPAPAFSLRVMNPDAAGTSWLALDKYAGEQPEDDGSKLVVLSFFASWCGPCKKEMPFLAQLDRMYRDQGLRIIGVCIDAEEAGIATARKLVAENKVGYAVVSDRFNFLARRYLGETAPLPSVFLVRRDGAIARIERGYSKDAGAFLLTAIQQELGIKAAPAAAAAEPPKRVIAEPRRQGGAAAKAKHDAKPEDAKPEPKTALALDPKS